ncbi:MAG: DUF3380 domain-containing protein [Ardenticatenaceae bacterium]|nr:DUF3380 domain-containing protein [Ardenticatenaceae bacterium]
MTNRTGKTTAALNMRSGPGTEHGVVTVLQPFTPLVIVAEQDDWLTVIAGSQRGFVHRDFVTIDPDTTPQQPPETDPPAATGRTRSIVNLREGPGQETNFVRRLPANTPLNIRKQVGDWFRVRLQSDNTKGYIQRSFVMLDMPQEPTETPKTQKGRATTVLNMRSGPGTENGIVAMLAAETELVILEHVGEWLKVTAIGQTGYVHGDFVMVEFEGTPPGHFTDPNDPNLPPLPDVPLEPTDVEKIATTGLAGNDATVARTWNRFGGLLTELSNRLRIDPGVAVAVLVAESGGRGFSADGRMIIRFENHVFNNLWGKNNSSVFAQHFTFDSARVWQGHQWRETPNSPWRSFHGNQSREWEVLTFAMSLDDTAAKKSISMGGPQIMGFNYSALGYESVQQMFTAFSASEAHQIIGFFNFVQGPATDARRMVALQRLDFDTFASLYNGPGQAAVYGQIIRNLYETYRRLRGK